MAAIDMHDLRNVPGMKYMMRKFMGGRKALTVRVMQCVNPDDTNTIFDECHSRQLLVEWRILESYSARFDDTFNRDRRISDIELSQNFLSGVARSSWIA